MGKISEAICSVFGPESQQGNFTASGETSVSYKRKNTENSDSCNSCRYINTACMTGLSIYLFSAVRKPLPDSTPFQRNARKLTGLVLSACFAAAAVTRFAEIGPFEKKRTS